MTVLTAIEQMTEGARMIRDGLHQLVQGDDHSIEVALAVRSTLKAVEEDIRMGRGTLEQGIADSMSADMQMVEGVGVVRRRKNLGKSQLPNGKENLLHDVLDSVKVDKDTGEIIPETEKEKILAFWDLSVHGARAGEMKARGLKWADYAETVDRGWTLQVEEV
jgi:hypothetical protein